MDPILAGLASSSAWALVRGGAGAAKAYVLGDPKEERALHHVLELAVLDAIEELTAGAGAATTEETKDALERLFFSDPAVTAEMLASVVEVREPDVGMIGDRFDALDKEEGVAVDLEAFARSFQRRASRNLDEETKKKDSVLANMVIGGRIKVLLEERRAESRRLAEQRRGAIPRRPGDLVGRDADIQVLLGMVRSAVKTEGTPGGQRGPRTIVVGGLPGVGKTAAVAELANRDELEALFPDGVLWSSLGASPDLLSVVAGWSRSVGGPDLRAAGSVSEASSRLAAFLRGKKILVIADDVFEPEHAAALKVPDRGAVLVSTRFPAVEGALEAAPADVHRLETLGEEDSVRLLRRQAPSLSGQDPAAVAGLARELGGLPLFLKVAGRLLEEEAGYGRGAAELLADLRAGKEALFGERAPADVAGFDGDRARTLEALMRASLEGLSEEQRAAFGALGTMVAKPATFDLEAAEAVWDSSEGRALMRPLVRRGLVEADGEGRFSVHSVLGSFARFLLRENGHSRGPYLRHARHFAGVLGRASEEYRGGEEGLGRAVRRLDSDWQNILRGWSWTRSNGVEDDEAACLCFGYLEVGQRWPSMRLTPKEHEDFARAAVACARRLGDGLAEAGSVLRLGHALIRADRYGEAKDAFQDARDRYAALGDDLGIGKASGALGTCYAASGDVAEAERLYLEQVRMAHGQGQTLDGADSEATGRGNLGLLYRDGGRYEDAAREMTVAAEMYDRLGDAREAAGARGNLGTVYHDWGDYDEAERQHLAYLQTARDLGDRDSECRALGNLANVNRARGEHEKSLAYYEENLVLARQLGLPHVEGKALAGAARARAMLGEPEAAKPQYERALGIVRSVADPRMEARILTDLAWLARLQNQPGEAFERAEAALSVHEDLDLPAGRADALMEASVARHEMGARAAAVRGAERARELYASVGSPRVREVEEQLTLWREDGHE